MELLTDDQCKGQCLAVHYELVPGDGDDDNSSFTINESYLQSSTVFDYEQKNTYSIRIKSTSSNGGYTYEKKFTILINDVPDQITDLQLSIIL